MSSYKYSCIVNGKTIVETYANYVLSDIYSLRELIYSDILEYVIDRLPIGISIRVNIYKGEKLIDWFIIAYE